LTNGDYGILASNINCLVTSGNLFNGNVPFNPLTLTGNANSSFFDNSANIPTINGDNTFTGTNTFSGHNIIGNLTGNITGSSGSCSGNAATVTNGAYVNVSNTFTTAQEFTNHLHLSGAGNSIYPTGSGSQYCGLTGSRWTASYATDVYGTNAYHQASDITTKKNILPSSLGLTWILKLNPISYQWDNSNIDTRTHWGLSAQDVKLAADSVGVDFGGWSGPSESGDCETLAYSELIGPMIKAIQELSAQVQSLSTQINK
jgi:hypothetical protein